MLTVFGFVWPNSWWKRWFSFKYSLLKMNHRHWNPKSGPRIKMSYTSSVQILKKFLSISSSLKFKRAAVLHPESYEKNPVGVRRKRRRWKKSFRGASCLNSNLLPHELLKLGHSPLAQKWGKLEFIRWAPVSRSSNFLRCQLSELTRKKLLALEKIIGE